MKQKEVIVAAILGLILVGGFVLLNTVFIIAEPEQALIVQLGKPQRTITEPGLKFKTPFVQKVIRFDKRILEYDANPKELITKDKQQLVVDNYSRWRIVDPLMFYQTLRTQSRAQTRLDDVIYSDVRETLGRHNMGNIITDRSAIMEEIVKNSQIKAEAFGIELIDVRIKRVDLPDKNELNVFQRMRTERERLAKKFRAEGEEEANIIRSEADRAVKVILAEADRKASIIRGQGEALATKTYAKAYNRDPEFYSFVRTLESYEQSLQDDTTLVLSSDSEFFKYLRSISPR